MAAGVIQPVEMEDSKISTLNKILMLLIGFGCGYLGFKMFNNDLAKMQVIYVSRSEIMDKTYAMFDIMPLNYGILSVTTLSKYPLK